MLNVRADPTNPNHKEITEWLGEYDPKVIDEEQIQIGLDDIANPRSIHQDTTFKAERLTGYRP